MNWDRRDLAGKWRHIRAIPFSHTLNLGLKDPSFSPQPLGLLGFGYSLASDYNLKPLVNPFKHSERNHKAFERVAYLRLPLCNSKKSNHIAEFEQKKNEKRVL